MSEIIQEIFKNIFGNNSILATILISTLPIIELRGGIPFGMSKTFWGSHALTSWESFGYAFLGSSLVVPILALIFLPVINWLKKTKLFKNLATKIENSIKSKSKKLEENYSTNSNDELDKTEEVKEGVDKRKVVYNKKFFLKLLGVFAFVAIPLPLTGVWTGTAIAVMLGIPYIWICLTVILGNLIAGIIMQTICAIFPNFTTWILIIFLAITLLLIMISLIKNKINKNKTKKENN